MIHIFSSSIGFIRALTAMELNSYIAMLAPSKQKNSHYSNGAKGKIFTFTLLQCTVMHGCAL